MLIRYWAKLRKRLGARRFQAYAIGPGKTGTHSIAGMFSNCYRTAHEPDIARAIRLTIDHRRGRVSDEQLRQYVREIDGSLQLEMSASGPSTFLAPFEAEEFPESKFLLLVRDCFSWTNSGLNQVCNHPAPQQHFRDWREAEFGDRGKCEFAPQEQILAEHQLWPLSALFSSWARYYEVALASIPNERLLVIHTKQITASLPKIASFLGIPASTLDAERTVEYRAPVDHRLVSQIDHQFVNAAAEEHCGALMRRFFPDTPVRIENFLTS